MKRINPDKMSAAEFEKLGTAARKVTLGNTRPLMPADRKQFNKATRTVGRPRVGAGRGGSTSQ